MERIALLAAWRPPIQGLLRIVTALVFLQYGTAKLFGFPYVEPLATVPPFSLFWYAGLIETTGAPLLLIGFMTGPVALILSGEMAFAYFFVHLPTDIFPLRNGGNEAILFCFIFLEIAATGPGAWSIDGWRAARR